MQNNQAETSCKRCGKVHKDVFEQMMCEGYRPKIIEGMSKFPNLETELKEKVAQIRAKSSAGTSSPSPSVLEYIPVKERKIRAAIKDHRIERLTLPGLYAVRSEREDMQYLVSLNDQEECSCTGYQFTGHCYHLEAVKRAMKA